ncbi:PREDICTED: D(1A) dopamine receptor-like [Amphimedon queenslandica]|uniref:G-protein coupled receptors family 1 profile domain-containing protein n=1 Tax=Amphimedon queenslandica TaxID=400682 RepID=A0A1X7U7H4_AMPQE|nr:PREDICTED: D(1A) dopamine receptor-like [Amphimedon queenslandica]|eukprot:XP_011405829.1 PREDICTED: D(1A) dopamine receptor-like [Amphimedon queenslandica]
MLYFKACGYRLVLKNKEEESMDAVHNNFTLSPDINGPLLAAVISIEMIGGLIANSFVLILTICHIKTWKQPSTIFLTNMLISNLLIVLFVMPFPVITSAFGEWIFGSTLDQKESVCKFTAIMSLFCVAVATEGLALLSFDRFLFIVRAFQYNRYMSINKSLIAISISWAIAGIISIVPVLEFNVYEFAYSFWYLCSWFRGTGWFCSICFYLSSTASGEYHSNFSMDVHIYEEISQNKKD